MLLRRKIRCVGIGPAAAGQGLSLCPFAAPGVGSFGRSVVGGVCRGDF
ncbi:hypothetical protein C7S13_5001 [Burkholderia cepacia]|nr:hypothetical protein [Burkholderia cepacia]